MISKISIIIPTLNEERFLPRLLKNLASQTSKDFEVIVVDGKSSDKTVQKASQYMKKIPLSIVHSDIKNVSHQRNLGAQFSKGDYLFFLDADSQISNQCMKQLIEAIRKYRYFIYQLTLVPESQKYPNKVFFNVINYSVELSQNINQPMSNGGSMVIHKALFKQLNGFDEKVFLSEDHDIVKRAYMIGVRAKYLKHVDIVFSLRRFQRDGIIPVLYKYSLAFIYTLAKGRVDKKLFEYTMGGLDYKKKPSKRQFEQIKKIYEQLMKILEE